MADFKIDPSYKEVSERIQDFKTLYPTGCLQPADPQRPFWVEQVGDQTFVCYAAAAYRTPDDPRPGIGVAWEPCPGKTPYTKDSEAMNAETSAWGRAIVAVLASESKTIASANEVRNRQVERAIDMEPPGSEARKPVRSSKSVASGGGTDETRIASEKQRYMLRSLLKKKGSTPIGIDGWPVGWLDAGFPPNFEAFPFSKVNDALEFIDALPEPA